MASFAQQEQQEQQQVNEIHDDFIQINTKIQEIHEAITILDTKVPDANKKISKLIDIKAKIHTSYGLVYTTENKIAAALKQHNIINIEIIRNKYQDEIDNLHSSREDPAFLEREDMTIGSTNGTMNTEEQVNIRITEAIQREIDGIIRKMQNELTRYGQTELPVYKDSYALIGKILGYLEFMERIVDEHIKLLKNPPNSGGKKKRKTKKMKKKAKTKKSKKSKMKKIKRKTMKKKKSKKHKR